MTKPQRLLIVASLVVVGLVLAFLMLGWGSQYDFLRATRVFVLYERQNVRYRNLSDEMGIYTEYGIVGILLGVIAPLCLFAAAGFVYLGGRKKP
jgi:hypothetical protein